MDRNPTMNDVAREAGVSLRTVSRYVNGETNIDPTLANRIGVAINVLGYRKNFAAASIRPGNTSRVIGLIIGDIGNPFYAALTRAIETVARRERYLLITGSSEEDGERHDDLVERLMQQRVEGLIIVPPRSPGKPWSDYRPPVPPVVIVDRPAPVSDSDLVIADNEEGARKATAKLIETVGNRVAFLGDSIEIYTMAERYRGYVRALADAGFTQDSTLVYTDAHNSADAAVIVESILHQSRPVSAIFAANNRAAIGALMAFSAAGKRLPLIGFDDFEAAIATSPQVSAVNQDIDKMGRVAAELLIGRIRGAEDTSSTVVVPTTLILRGSELP